MDREKLNFIADAWKVSYKNLFVYLECLIDLTFIPYSELIQHQKKMGQIAASDKA